MIPTTTFSTARLLLRSTDSTDKDDVATMRRLHLDPIGFVSSMGNPVKPMSMAGAVKMAEHGDECLISVFLCLPKSAEEPGVLGEVIGWSSLKPINPAMVSHRRTTFGIKLMPQHQGKGYGTEALGWLLDWAFRVYGLHKIDGGVFAWNTAARALYRKVGFTEEGYHKGAFWQEGAWQDDVSLGLLAEDYFALQAKKNAAKASE